MDHVPTSEERSQLRSYPNAQNQAILLLVILKELILHLLAPLRGVATLEDIRARLRSSRLEYCTSFDRTRDKLPTPATGSGGSGPTFDRYTRPLVSAVQQLCRALVLRDHQSVSRILEAASWLVSRRHEGGWFPLHAAVLSGDAELVKLVLSQPNADVNAVHESVISSTLVPDHEAELGTSVDDTIGATPLHYACMIGNIDVVNVLVQHGALLNIQDERQREPIEYFNMQRDSEAITAFRLLYAERRDWHEFYHEYASIDDLAELIRQNKYDLFERAVMRHPQLVSKLTYYDFTLLHLAVIRQRRAFVKLLISVDPSLVNETDSRSSWSCESSYSSFAPSTIPHRYVKDATPLHYACLTEDMDVITLLFKAGADWNIQDYRGRKPEQLIYPMSANYEHLKHAFSQLCTAEEERRKVVNVEKARCANVDVWMETGCLDSEASAKWGESNDPGRVDVDFKESAFDNENENRIDVSLPKVPIHTLLSLEKALEEKLVGQRGPIRTIAHAIRLRESEWVFPDRPLTLLFLGSSGVGKTELAKQLALYMHGQDGLAMHKGESINKLEKEHAFVRIDMSEYQERHSAYNLIGAPKSYAGYGDGGALTRPLKKNPNAIVLLDEIEKAHPDVLNLFLQVFDDGRITDSKDGVISCKGATFVMTSNIASDEIKEKAPELRDLVALAEEQDRPELYLHTIQEFTRYIRPVLKQALKRDEFIGRINQIAVFLPLSEEEIELVVEREMGMWARRAEEKHKIKLSWTNEVVRNLASAYDVDYGVRSVANEVQRIAIQLVANAQMTGRISDNCQAFLSTNEVGDIVLDTNPLSCG